MKRIACIAFMLLPFAGGTTQRRVEQPPQPDQRFGVIFLPPLQLPTVAVKWNGTHWVGSDGAFNVFVALEKDQGEWRVSYTSRDLVGGASLESALRGETIEHRGGLPLRSGYLPPGSYRIQPLP